MICRVDSTGMIRMRGVGLPQTEEIIPSFRYRFQLDFNLFIKGCIFRFLQGAFTEAGCRDKGITLSFFRTVRNYCTLFSHGIKIIIASSFAKDTV